MSLKNKKEKELSRLQDIFKNFNEFEGRPQKGIFKDVLYKGIFEKTLLKDHHFKKKFLKKCIKKKLLEKHYINVNGVQKVGYLWTKEKLPQRSFLKIKIEKILNFFKDLLTLVR